MEDVDVQTLGNSPYSSRVGVGGNAFVQNAGGAQRERAIDDIRVARDPADVGHAPVNIFGMNVLNVLRSAGDIRHVSAGAMLAAFGFAGAPAGVHKEERGFRVHGNGRHDLTGVIGKNFVDEHIPPFNKGGSGGILARVPAPDQNLIYDLAFLLREIDRDVGGGLVVEHLAVAVVAIHRDQDAAAGVGRAQSASFSAVASEHY